MLSENQTQWIFETCRKLMDKYLKLLPMDDNAWHEFFEEIKRIEKNARHDRLTIELLVTIGNYLGKENDRLIGKGV